jgi:hypothetical protein
VQSYLEHFENKTETSVPCAIAQVHNPYTDGEKKIMVQTAVVSNAIEGICETEGKYQA